MAESKQNQAPMSIEAFRAKKGTSSPVKTTASPSKIPALNSSTSRPASASRASLAKRSVSTEHLNTRDGTSLDERQEKVKLLREKQAEDRRRKNEERRAAFEERRRKKEESEKERWSALKEQAAQQNSPKQNISSLKPGSGRKLPNVPVDGVAKRPGSSLEGLNRPSSLPKPLDRPSRASHTKATTNGANRSPQSSSDNLSGSSTPKESPLTAPLSSQGKTSLGSTKSTSASSLEGSSASNRRASDGYVAHRPLSGSRPKSRTVSQHSSAQALNKQSSKKSTSHELLIPAAGKLSKAHSTSSLHKVGHSGEKAQRTDQKPKAGVTDEEAAKQALAERRKKAREEAERQAALDKEHQEAERLRKEEEERIRAEEEAKEEARMRELAELLRKQEEERLRLAAEEKERKEREEAERLAEEKIRKEEDERKAKEEEMRKAQEDKERRKQEEAARLERKRRVEQIMSRTRQTAAPTITEENSSVVQEVREVDRDTKKKVSEIMQRVKGTSVTQQTTTSTEVSEDENDSRSGDNSMASMDLISESRKTVQPDSLESNAFGGLSDHAVRMTGLARLHSLTLEKDGPGQMVSFHHHEEPVSLISKDSFGANGINGRSTVVTDGENDVRLSHNIKQGTVDNNSDVISRDLLHDGDKEDAKRWQQIESTMKEREQHAVETLENLGVVAEGDNDEDSEEGQLWKVVEGKMQLTEVV